MNSTDSCPWPRSYFTIDNFTEFLGIFGNLQQYTINDRKWKWIIIKNSDKNEQANLFSKAGKIKNLDTESKFEYIVIIISSKQTKIKTDQ